jgi:hypothetical protein
VGDSIYNEKKMKFDGDGEQSPCPSRQRQGHKGHKKMTITKRTMQENISVQRFFP